MIQIQIDCMMQSCKTIWNRLNGTRQIENLNWVTLLNTTDTKRKTLRNSYKTQLQQHEENYLAKIKQICIKIIFKPGVWNIRTTTKLQNDERAINNSDETWDAQLSIDKIGSYYHDKAWFLNSRPVLTISTQCLIISKMIFGT